MQDFATFFRSEAPQAVIFSAGSGGKGGEERTKAVDYEGAVKIFDAMEEAGVKRIVMVSAADLRGELAIIRSYPPPASSSWRWYDRPKQRLPRLLQ